MEKMFATDLTQYSSRRATGAIGAGILAGLAGGAAEIAWIGIYENVAGGDAAVVAGAVAQTFLPGLAPGAAAVALGLAIHMALAATLGIAIAIAVSALLPRLVGATHRSTIEPAAIVLALIGVWTINFYFVLPAINPEFVALLPLGVSFASKVLFGVAAAFVFRFVGRRRQAARPVA
jgi:hypothetical protein